MVLEGAFPTLQQLAAAEVVVLALRPGATWLDCAATNQDQAGAKQRGPTSAQRHRSSLWFVYDTVAVIYSEETSAKGNHKCANPAEHVLVVLGTITLAASREPPVYLDKYEEP
jgi:hypothetical protein